MRCGATWILGCFLFSGMIFGAIPDEADIIKRGDANNDNSVNVSDASYINSYLYSGGPAPPCLNQADVNNDGSVNVSDSIYLLNWLYSSGNPPPSPGPTNTSCAADDYPYPGCESSSCD